MMRHHIAAGALAALMLAAPAAIAAEAVSLPRQAWSFGGVFGTFDRDSAQRGLQVYREVCAGCHALNLLAYRHLAGIGVAEDQIKAIAAEKEVTDGPNDEGKMFQRPGRPADRFVSPFANEQAARYANNGAFPPDLSLMVKARKGGTDYLYALLTGFRDPPADLTLYPGMQYNLYFPGHQLAMPAILADGMVTYADGTQATAAQMAKDVTTFLAWAAEPEMEERKRIGLAAILYLLVLSALLYATNRKVWAGAH